MLISPLSLERIRLSLKKLQADTVMLFDDAAITGKSFREMKAFVADLGAKVSKVVFILNRTRLPALRQHIPKQSYFWRLDIPIMGGGRTCPLCRALVMARDLDTRLTSNSARARIQVWHANWQRTSPTSDWSIERGLYPLSLDQRITKKFGLCTDDMGKESPHLIHLDRSPAVAAYNSELRAMTGLDDNALVFAIKCKEKKQPLPWSVQIELLASQLLLFGHEVETGTISRILVALLAAAFEAPDTDDSTALAALVCLVAAEERLDLKSMIDKAMELADQQSDSLNLDMRIVIAALIDSGSLDGTKFLSSRRLLSASGLPLADRYRMLYEETEGSLGAAHSTPLPRWANPDNVVDCHKRRLDALDSLDKLQDLIIGLDVNQARMTKASHSIDQDSEDPGDIMEQSLSQIRAVLDSERNPTTGVVKTSFKYRKDSLLEEVEINREKLLNLRGDAIESDVKGGEYGVSQKSIMELLQKIRRFRNDYFFFMMRREDIQRREEGTLDTEALPDLFKDINWAGIQKEEGGTIPTMKVSINDGISERRLHPFSCVPWDKTVTRILKDILSNARHAQKPIVDPWERETGHAKLWLSVDYGKSGVSIRFANEIDTSVSEVWDDVKKRHWDYIYELGGKIGYEEGKPRLFEICVFIPYVHYCREPNHSR